MEKNQWDRGLYNLTTDHWLGNAVLVNREYVNCHKLNVYFFC